MRRIFLSLLFIPFCFQIQAQIGGEGVYEFLNLNTSARVASLGGNQIAVRDNDPLLAIDNPALLNPEMDNKLALTYSAYLADANIGYASFTKDFDSIGTFNLGVKYIDYGQFRETDFVGNDLGTFNAGEYAFIIGYARPLDTNFNVGANLKTIYSSLYDYNSLGLALDLGLNYYSKKREINVSLLARNMGRQLSTYSDNDVKEDLPFEVQLGFSKRLSKVPLRLGIVAQHLQRWDLTYDDPTPDETNVFGDDNQDDDNDGRGFFSQLGRHMIFNTEFLITENFNVRLGYNLLRRAELKIDEKLGTIGLSWGLGFRISKFHFSYARSAYHQVGATNTFSISTRLIDFMQ